MNAKGAIVIVFILLIAFIGIAQLQPTSNTRYSNVQNTYSDVREYMPIVTSVDTSPNIGYIISQSDACQDFKVKGSISRNGCLLIDIAPSVNNVINEVYIDGYLTGKSSIGLNMPFRHSRPEGTYNIRLVTQNGDFSIIVPLVYEETTMISVFQ